jgi:hypothetical protein
LTSLVEFKVRIPILIFLQSIPAFFGTAIAHVSYMTATAALDIAAQVPQAGQRLPDAGVTTAAKDTLKNSRCRSESKVGDFRTNWQQFLNLMHASEGVPELAEAFRDEPGQRFPAVSEESVTDLLSAFGAKDAAADEPSQIEDGSLPLPSTQERAPLLRIRQQIAIRSSDAKTPHELQTTLSAQTTRHGEVKAGVEVDSIRHGRRSAGAGERNATELIPVQDTLASSAFAPTSESAKPVVSHSGSESEVRLKSFDSIASSHRMKQTIRNDSASLREVQNLTLSEEGEEPSEAIAGKFLADLSATSDGDVAGMSLPTRTTLGSSASYASDPALSGKQTRQSRALVASSPVGDGEGARTQSLPERPAPAASISQYAETSKGGSEAGLNQVRGRAIETKSSNVPEAHLQPAHTVQTASPQPRDLESPHLGALADRDPSTTTVFALRESASIASPAKVNNSESTGGELFTALDTVRGSGAPAWVRTGAHMAEAGYQDPDIGWVTVRAHAAANGFHAALVPSSMEAAQSLGVHLSGLSAYLADHHKAVQSVSVSAPEIRWDGQSLGQKMDNGTSHGGSQERGPGSSAEVDSTIRPASHPIASQQSEGIEGSVFVASGSRFISVVA